jgi:ferredoxin
MAGYRVEVDHLLCQGHGVCVEECPEVFEVEDQGTGYAKVRVRVECPGEELRASVQDAVDYCPNRVIRIVEL